MTIFNFKIITMNDIKHCVGNTIDLPKIIRRKEREKMIKKYYNYIKVFIKKII